MSQQCPTVSHQVSHQCPRCVSPTSARRGSVSQQCPTESHRVPAFSLSLPLGANISHPFPSPTLQPHLSLPPLRAITPLNARRRQISSFTTPYSPHQPKLSRFTCAAAVNVKVSKQEGWRGWERRASADALATGGEKCGYCMVCGETLSNTARRH